MSELVSNPPTERPQELIQEVTQGTKEDAQEKYYPCDDPNRPICRQFVNQGGCHKRKRCHFYHPKVITHVIQKKASRELGHCYCGAAQKTIIRFQPGRPRTRADDPGTQFFVVCARTGRSMRNCM